MANTLIATAKLNGVEPLASLTGMLERIVSRRTKAHELHSLLPWNWHQTDQASPPHQPDAATSPHPTQAAARQIKTAVVATRRLRWSRISSSR